MGVEQPGQKKKFLRTHFPSSHSDYPYAKNCYLSLSPRVPRAPIIDGSVQLEPALAKSTPATILKSIADDKDASLRVAKEIYCRSLKAAIIDSVNISTIVYILGDTHERPEIKEDRGYGTEVPAVFSEAFPIGSKKMIADHIAAIREKYYTTIDAHVKKSRVAKRKKKVGDESDDDESTPEEEPKSDATLPALEPKKLEKMNEEIAEFSQHKFDCWSEGKRLPANRFSVYRALTAHFVRMIQETLSECKTQHIKVILENAVLDEDEYVTLHINSLADLLDLSEEETKSDNTKIGENGIVRREPGKHHGICECEQCMIYWIYKLAMTEKTSAFVLDTTDTDIYACVALNWPAIIANSPETNAPGMAMLKTPNLSKEDKERGLYVMVDFQQIFSRIENLREWGFLTFIVLGNDFVAKEMHTLLQATKGGMYGDERTNKLLELLLSRRGEAPRPLAQFQLVNDIRYRGGKEWKVTFDIASFVALVTKYRKEDKTEKKAFSGFTDVYLARIKDHAMNAVYACEYFLNQWRLRKDAGKLFKDPASDVTRYGYKRDASGKLVFSELLKKKKKKAPGSTVKRPRKAPAKKKKVTKKKTTKATKKKS